MPVELLSQFLNRKPLEPLMVVSRVVATAGPGDAKKPRETVDPQFAMKNAKGVIVL
jgi:hypothetical protein